MIKYVLFLDNMMIIKLETHHATIALLGLSQEVMNACVCNFEVQNINERSSFLMYRRIK